MLRQAAGSNVVLQQLLGEVLVHLGCFMGIYGVPKRLVQVCKQNTWSKSPLQHMCILRTEVLYFKYNSQITSSHSKTVRKTWFRQSLRVSNQPTKWSLRTFQQCWGPQLNRHVRNLAGKLHGRHDHVVTFLKWKNNYWRAKWVETITSTHFHLGLIAGAKMLRYEVVYTNCDIYNIWAV